MFDLLRKADEPSRRSFLSTVASAAFGVSIVPSLGRTAAAQTAAKAKQCIYLYMGGAMSHIDTFDPKPGSRNQGDTGVVQTKVAGVQFGEQLAKLATHADRLAVARSMTSTTGAHEPGQYLMKTNYKKIATIRHPGFGSWLQKMKGRRHRDLPATVHIGNGIGPGYLGAQFAPVPIGDPTLGLQNTTSPEYLTDAQFNHRMQLSAQFDEAFRARAKSTAVNSYDDLYSDAIRLLKSKDLEAFDLAKESEDAKAAYGETRFGQGCLLARRLVERGVQFVEVNFGSWDHHVDLWERLPDMAAELDVVVSALLEDLQQKGMLDETLVVLATEFGRRPSINENAGRDHHPAAFSCVLAGGGIRGGQVYGATDEDAYYVEDDVLTVHDFNATIAQALGLPLKEEIISPNGRPFTIANGGTPIATFF